MAIITAGYDGTVDEVQFAKLLHRYSVSGPGDFKATTIAGDRIVSIANGTALGPGTVDVATDIPPIQFEAATGTRWDMVVLRRDWQPPGGLTEIRIVKGGSSDTLPAAGTAATAWNRRPGIMDDQPLYLQEINGTLLGNRIDLRCWQSNGGLVANHDRVRSYLDTPGTHVHINGIDWVRRVGANDTAEWVKVDELGRVPLFGVGASLVGGAPPAGTQFLEQEGSFIGTTDSSGFCRLTFPVAFPSGLLNVQGFSGDSDANGPGTTFESAGAAVGNVFGQSGLGSKTDWVYRMVNASGAIIPDKTHRINWRAKGW